MAKLYFRYGAMNSGKTTALMQVAYNYKERGMRVLILKPAVDTKGQDSIVSRLGISCKVDKLVTPEMDVVELVKQDSVEHGAPACVLCDESQFFTPEQAEQLARSYAIRYPRRKRLPIQDKVLAALEKRAKGR